MVEKIGWKDRDSTKIPLLLLTASAAYPSPGWEPQSAVLERLVKLWKNLGNERSKMAKTGGELVRGFVGILWKWDWSFCSTNKWLGWSGCTQRACVEWFARKRTTVILRVNMREEKTCLLWDFAEPCRNFGTHDLVEEDKRRVTLNLFTFIVYYAAQDSKHDGLVSPTQVTSRGTKLWQVNLGCNNYTNLTIRNATSNWRSLSALWHLMTEEEAIPHAKIYCILIHGWDAYTPNKQQFWICLSTTNIYVGKTTVNGVAYAFPLIFTMHQLQFFRSYCVSDTYHTVLHFVKVGKK